MIGSGFETDLLRDERIVWTGRPDSGRIFEASDILMIPFSLLWGGFAIFWEASVLGLTPITRGRPVPTIYALWGIPFVLLGLYMIFGRFVYRAWSRRRTSYALTTRRALILTEAWGRSLRSFNLDALPGVTTSSRADGSGTILFEAAGSGPTRLFFGFPLGGRRTTPPGFYDIPDVRTVGAQIEDLRGGDRT